MDTNNATASGFYASTGTTASSRSVTIDVSAASTSTDSSRHEMLNILHPSPHAPTPTGRTQGSDRAVGLLEVVVVQRKRVWALMTVLVGSGACSGGEEPAPSTTQHDSAGVHVVENGRTARSSVSKWIVDTMPLVRIGGGLGDRPLFRVQGAVRLTSGQIAVADGGSSEIRYYDDNGRLTVTTGGQGEGPGEFVRISQLLRAPSDSLMVYDGALRRLTILARDGDVARTELLPDDTGSDPVVAGVFSNGTLLIRAPQPKLAEGRFRIPTTLWTLSNGVIDSVGLDVGWTAVSFQAAGRPFLLVAPFGTFGYTVVSGDAYYTLRSDRYEVRRFNSSGELEAIVRRAVSPRPIGSADVDAELERHLDRYTSEGAVRDAVFAVLKDMAVPGTMPVVGPFHESLPALKIDGDGHVWVREYTPPRTSGTHWSVFDTNGVYLSTVDMVSGLEPSEIGTDYVLGVRTDADGVEYVQLHRLDKT